MMKRASITDEALARMAKVDPLAEELLAHRRAALPRDEALREAAQDTLDVLHRFMSGQSITNGEKALADRVAMAACFAAEAFNHAAMEEDGIYGLQQSFLRALVDPLHPDLDYLRDDPNEGPKARAALEGRT